MPGEYTKRTPGEIDPQKKHNITQQPPCENRQTTGLSHFKFEDENHMKSCRLFVRYCCTSTVGEHTIMRFASLKTKERTRATKIKINKHEKRKKTTNKTQVLLGHIKRMLLGPEQQLSLLHTQTQGKRKYCPSSLSSSSSSSS